MGDIMRPIPLTELICRAFQEYAVDRTVFALPEAHFFRKSRNQQLRLFGEACETPLGPAAGPHTQLAQNIAASYLSGSRFIELKTVQEKEPPVEKPCIDAEDEGFNTEWSSEFTVEKAYAEYIKAWVLLHLLEETFELQVGAERAFIFNMSVGYNLAGIQSPRMNAYIDGLIDASQHPLFGDTLTELSELLQDGSFLNGTGLEERLPALRSLPERISPRICNSVTLSTMHGCPPEEIEKICLYMLTEKKLATYVKLNPTLLSYPVVRNILDDLGFDYVDLSPASFDHDLQYEDAIPMLKRLQAIAAEQGRFFGVKLTNTLGAVNFKNRLPGGEMYMSGRALFPLSINVAAKICREFDGELPISFSAGISEQNVADVFATGIRPITAATELLKPGGYARMTAMAAKLETLDGWTLSKIDPAKVEDLAAKALNADYAQKRFRGDAKASLAGDLPLFDCAEAPCQAACPIHQDIPAYIRLVGQERYAEALAVIYEKNALPSITGHICDHACQYRCTRLDYEGSVLIREVKRIAVKKGFAEYKEKWSVPAKRQLAKVAVMGAGPAGLASAYFLAREGFDVTVFERRESAGGTVRHVIPRYRISDEAIDSDVRFIEEHGVTFVFNASTALTPAELRSQGYAYVVVAVGAGAEKDFSVEGLSGDSGQPRSLSALSFLERFNRDPASLYVGKQVAVVGAGNTAMDAARTALRLPGVEKVTVIYRRTEKEMPAYREEYELALADGVEFLFLMNPERFDDDGLLRCRVMTLGAPDGSGRRCPEKTEEMRSLPVDTLITAIGETVDTGLLTMLGLVNTDSGMAQTNKESCATALPGVYLVGDASRGPSSIVKCIADGRKAADAICRAEDPAWKRAALIPAPAGEGLVKEIRAKKLGLVAQSDVPVEAGPAVDPAVGDNEFRRCLECHSVCNKCVEVCPNRANIAVAMDDGDGASATFRNRHQIVHLDAYCNECGNCATFCPWEGRPFTDKPTLFSLREDFEASGNLGFFVEDDTVHVRIQETVRLFPLAAGAFHVDDSDATLARMARIFAVLYHNRPSLFGRVDR
ncbi:putative selenate reductase subunit YgfK [Heliobacterium gestii]|uniref:Putative selenate reductase subunit YgfK n=1 Tax=Heliomicrobium gestii TaxID=2699 RepID=A0A845L6X7_HELGE|nr:putative selenate reductase subunit YgfK [Heliomicrobium gestii]MBM7866949.1 putative selenate reductase [Heliomicrobium gestii]MZP42372.1 putative selenate reductase subunit YgfK [Heliomicrobium gestii]